MIHLITLSGNSERFISKGYAHKSLVDINGCSAIEIFVNNIKDFNDYKTFFLCRNEDLSFTKLKSEIKKHCPKANILGINKNKKGPVYSISKILDVIPDNDKILITYIDSIQKECLKNVEEYFLGCDGGLLVHDLKHPHWRNNQYYCLVRHNKNLICSEVIEKYNFSGLNFSKSKNCCGSNGTYYVKTGEMMKKYFHYLLSHKKTINGEYYVTQIFQEMINDGLKVKAKYTPYASFGIPEDVEDFKFWQKWFQ